MDSAETVARYVERVWNEHDLSALDELTTPEYRRHLGPGAEPLDRDGQRQRIASVQAAFPDVTFSVEELFGAGEMVSLRATVRGTHQQTFLGREATGATVAFQALDTFRVVDSRITDHWGLLDVAALLAQLTG